jgi:predicted AlkP superfamily phosphohydrolase/phosphomutase/tetratricopeptide (TPR) repeat protein
MSKKKVKKFLLIGWDAAEWKVMEPLMEQGMMPTLKKFLSEAVSGKIATLDPPFSPMLWTSIATGKRAYDHGILGFIEPTPNGDALRPVMSTSRKVKALWNIFTQSGLKSNVVGWWPSHPAEPINGVMVSNFYQNFKDPLDKPWPMPDGTIHPAEMTETLKELRVHAEELTIPLISNYIPKTKALLEKYTPIVNDEKADPELKKRAQAYLNRINGVAKNMATCASIHNAGTYLMRNTEWDFMAVYFDTIDHMCHIGMKFHPPKMENADQDAFDQFNQVVTAGYKFHDMMLERQLSLIDEDTTVLILSDHGFHPDNLRPKSLPNEPASPAYEHSPYGMFAMKGPGIKKGEKIFGASLMDITPTILHLFGLPVAQDMEGKVLQQIFETNTSDAVDYIPSWEDVPGEAGTHKDTDQTNTWASREAMQQLIDLGYIEKPDENIGKNVENAVSESKYYLARNYINGNKYAEAIEILEEIHQKSPEITRYALRLANVYLSTRRYKKCKEIIEKIKTIKDYPEVKVKYIEGLLYLSTFKIRKGTKLLEELKGKSESPNLFFQIGRANNIRYRWKEAEEYFLKAINIDPNNNLSYHGLGVSYLRRNLLEQAAENFLIAIEINNNMPQTHYCLGETLMKLGLNDQAIEAFQMALYFQPNFVRAHKWLADLYKLTGKEDLAQKHAELASDKSKGERIIVAGLQRSGTALMMQCLKAAGIELLIDENDAKDEFNPNGYFEFKPAINLLMNKTWLENAENKAVKVYAKELPFLPKNYNYKIIWMDRPMTDIVSSYTKMQKKKAVNFDISLADSFTNQVDKVQAWLETMPNAEMHIIDFNDLLTDPKNEMEEVLAFLEKRELEAENINYNFIKHNLVV